MYIHTVYIYSSRKAFSKGDASSMVFVCTQKVLSAPKDVFTLIYILKCNIVSNISCEI